MGLERAQVGFTAEAKSLNLTPPRGIMLVGVPGCGKSLAAKAIVRAENRGPQGVATRCTMPPFDHGDRATGIAGGDTSDLGEQPCMRFFVSGHGGSLRLRLTIVRATVSRLVADD